MAGEIKALQFAEGTNVAAPAGAQLTIGSPVSDNQAVDLLTLKNTVRCYTTVANLRASTYHIDCSLATVKANKLDYVYDTSSSAADNGSSVLKPDDVLLANPGRWLERPGTFVGGSTSGSIEFKINGDLSELDVANTPANGRGVDGAFVSENITYSRARLFLKTPGDSGTLKCDVRRHITLEHGITEIAHQYQGSTQSIARIGSAINTQSIALAAAAENTQSISRPKSALNTQSIINVGGSLWRYNFSGSPLDTDYVVGDTVLMASHTNAANDGSFVIVSLNDDGLSNITVSNGSGVAQTAAAGTVNLQLFSYNLSAPANAHLVAGEKALFAAHTTGANNGSFTLYKVNQGGNNVWVKNSTVGATTQAGVAGTIDVYRWTYTYVAPASASYVVGEDALFASHTNAANDGNLPIRAVNSGGNNLIVYNEAGVAQAGIAGNANTNRWAYGLTASAAANVSVGHTLIALAHTSAANDGTFTVKEVDNGGNNIVFYNESGVAQAGVAGTLTHTRKLYKFASDVSSSYSVAASDVEIVNCQSTDNDGYFTVLEINRGGGANYNIVLDNPLGVVQASPMGSVIVESRSILTTPVELTEIKKFAVASCSLIGSAVPAEAVLALYVLEVPEGNPADLSLHIS